MDISPWSRTLPSAGVPLSLWVQPGLRWNELRVLVRRGRPGDVRYRAVLNKSTSPQVNAVVLQPRPPGLALVTVGGNTL